MKHCPECNKNYADPTLSYCLEDGAPLIYGAAVDDPETAILQNAPTQDDTKLFESGEKVGVQRPSASNRTAAFAGLLGLAVIAAIVISAYIYYGRSSSASIHSIAVMPFANQTGNQDLEFLSDGMTESLITSLAQVPDLKVMSRTSVFHYKGKEVDPRAVANELNVQGVLTGTVAERGDDLSISVELINPKDGTQLWGQRYNRKLADILAVQQEMAKEITEKLRVKLTGDEQARLTKPPTENLKAFQYYMQGRAYYQRSTHEDVLSASRYYELALEEDQNYALAYTGLAETYSVLGSRGYIAPIEGKTKSEEFARKALALDEKLAEAHAALGQSCITVLPCNFTTADGELRRAIELSPSFASAHHYLGLSYARQGRLDECLAEQNKARELDPLSSTIARHEALPYYLKRDYARSIETLRQANKLGPALSTTWEIGVYIQNRAFDEALAELEKAAGVRTDDPILIYDRGMIDAARGSRAEALQSIKKLEDMSGPNSDYAPHIAKIYSILNEKDQAISWLDRGLASGAMGSIFRDDPIWDPIRSDPRFTDILRRVGVPTS